MQKRGFHPTFLLFERPCVAEKNLAYSAARKVSPLNVSLISEQFVNSPCSILVQKQINGFLMNQIHEH